LTLPLSLRKKLAVKGRTKSKQAQAQLTADIMDVTQQAVVSSMQRFNVNRLIHGHTHRPAIHELIVNQQPAQRIVLGDWYDQGSILKVSADHVDLSHITL
jgi:UDP-2,3-diacylglucosamine hydrolase